MEVLCWALFVTLVLKATAAPTPHDKRQHIIYEAKDVKNTWAESRPARNTDAINYKVPEDCENECNELYEPVCGTDGITHENKCKLKVSACYKPEDNVKIDYLGECLRKNEPYIRNSNLNKNGNEIINVENKNEAMLDSDGCWYHVLSKVLPYGTKGYNKCIQMQCQQDKDWHPTGERLPNCDDGSVKCWNWLTNETVPLESTMDFECNQYLCTEEDWELSGERVSCEGCISAMTGDYLPHGFKSYWKCEQFECMKNNSWQNTGERLAGCSVGEVKCWDWSQHAAVPIGSNLTYNDIGLLCTEEDWLKINIHVSSSPEIEGCLSEITNEVDTYGTKGYYMCEQYECLSNKTWHKTGEKLSGCSLSEMKCLHWYSNETVPLDSVMFHNCTQYICTDSDWKSTHNVDLSCLENKGCLSVVTQEKVPYGWKGYYNCKQYECTEKEEWKPTDERLSDCVNGKSRCWDWHQDEGVPVNSVLIQDNIQYTCTENDWQKTTILNPSSYSNDGCLSKISSEVVPHDHKGYYVCKQFECSRNNTWLETGKNLSACSDGEVKCWDWKLGAAVSMNSRLFYNNHEYECTEEDWKPLPEQALDEPAMIPEERFDNPLCEPGVTIEHEGQQCCCSDEAILQCDGPCPAIPVTAAHQISPCTPGENITNEDGQVCCCISGENLDCTGPCEGAGPIEMIISKNMTTDDMQPVSASCIPGEPIEGQDEKCCCTSDGILDCSGNSCQEPESTTMMDMETTTEGSSSTKKEISLLLFLLTNVLFFI